MPSTTAVAASTPGRNRSARRSKSPSRSSFRRLSSGGQSLRRLSFRKKYSSRSKRGERSSSASSAKLVATKRVERSSSASSAKLTPTSDLVHGEVPELATSETDAPSPPAVAPLPYRLNPSPLPTSDHPIPAFEEIAVTEMIPTKPAESQPLLPQSSSPSEEEDRNRDQDRKPGTAEVAETAEAATAEKEEDAGDGSDDDDAFDEDEDEDYPDGGGDDDGVAAPLDTSSVGVLLEFMDDVVDGEGPPQPHPAHLPTFSNRMDVILTSTGGKRVVGTGSVGRSSYVPPAAASSPPEPVSSQLLPTPDPSLPASQPPPPPLPSSPNQDGAAGDDDERPAGTVQLLRIAELEKEIAQAHKKVGDERTVRKKKERNMLKVARQMQTNQQEIGERGRNVDELKKQISALKISNETLRNRFTTFSERTVAEKKSHIEEMASYRRQIRSFVEREKKKKNGNRALAAVTPVTEVLRVRVERMKTECDKLETQLSKAEAERERPYGRGGRGAATTIRRILGAVLSGTALVLSHFPTRRLLCAPAAPGVVMERGAGHHSFRTRQAPWAVPYPAKDVFFDVFCRTGLGGAGQTILRSSVAWDAKGRGLVVTTGGDGNTKEEVTVIKGRKFLMEADRIVNVKGKDSFTVTKVPWIRGEEN